MDVLVAQRYVNSWANSFTAGWASVQEFLDLTVFRDVRGLRYITIMETSSYHVVLKVCAPARGGLFFFEWSEGELYQVNLVHEVIDVQVEATYPRAYPGSTDRYLIGR
jgi:hypothetical protein